MKKFTVMLLAVLTAGLTAAEPARNLLNNGELKLNESGTLPGWIYPRKGAWILNKDNTIGLREGFEGHSAYWVQQIEAKPFTGYKLEFEVKAEDLGRMAGVYYVWYDAAGKRLASERFAYRHGPGSTDGWEKVSAVLNQADPVKTAKLSVCFAIYNAQPKGGGKVFFRNISLTAINEEDDDKE